MAELEQSFDENDGSENPENLEPKKDTIQYDISGIPENSEPEEDTVQDDITGIPENSAPEEDNVQHDMSGMPEVSESEVDTIQHDTSRTSENPQPDMDKVQTENDSQPKEKEEHKDNVLRGGENKWSGWPGESVFRLLIPTQKAGRIIGPKGELIKKICEETRASIRVLRSPGGSAERAVLVSAKEEPDVSLPPAVDGLLSVLKKVVDGLECDPSGAPSDMCSKVSTRFLVPATQARILIGKQGTTVKSIEEESGCTIRVLGAELPAFALQDDRIVEVVGEPLGVHKAVELIASHLRKFLVDRSMIPVFEMLMQMTNHQMEQDAPSPQMWGPPPQDFPWNTGRGPNPHFMLAPGQIDNYYSPAEMPPSTGKQQHHGISAYGREVPTTMHAPSHSLPVPLMITQVTQKMQIPLSYADTVIGSAGSSISYIRRVSWATVAIQETTGIPGEMTVEISGTPSQVRTARQLIQNLMSESAAAGSTQDQACAPTTEQGYNRYATPSSSGPQPGVYGQTSGHD